MTANTTPDNIVSATTGDGVTIAAATTALANSVQTALNNRQRYEYVWANAAARTTQAGMVNGSTGYQVDTKSEYIYDASAWRLKLQYVQFDQPSQAIANNTYTAPSALNANSGLSTDTTFVTSASGQLTLAQPGIYSISWTATAASPVTSGFLVITSDLAHTQFLTIAPWTAGVSTATLPFYRTTAANTTIYPFLFQGSGATVNITSNLRIGRLG